MSNIYQSLNGSVLIPRLDLEWQELRRKRKLACEHNFELFCRTYLPHYFYAEPSVLHRELFLELQEAIENNEPDNIVKAAPRGNAKSTITSLALPIWCAVYKKKHYILIISDTADQAADFLSNVRDELEDNFLLVDDFGNQIGLVWTNSDIITRGDVRIQALGAGKKVRGRRYKQWRPDLIICDDLENDENVRSPEQRVKDEGWFTKALSKAGDERTDKVVIGTILHYDSLLSKILRNPTYNSKIYKAVIRWSASPLWPDWERLVTDLTDPNRLQTALRFFKEHQIEMLEGTEVLWPEKESYYQLMLQRIADGPAAFSSEKQNEPLSAEDRRFDPEWISYFDDTDIAGKELFVVGFVDPSMGKKNKGNDPSATITLGMDANYVIYVLEADIDRKHPDVIIEDVLFKHNTYGYKLFGVEENQFQEYFKDNMKKRMQEWMNEGRLASELPLRGIHQVSDKELRIESLQPDIKNGRVKFRRDQQKLIEQLTNFPSADHDDGPDALEGAMNLLGRRSAVADYYKAITDEANRPTPQSILQNPNLQRIIG